MSKKKKLENISVGEVFRRIILPRKQLLLLGLLLILLRSAATLVIPRATKFLIDDVLVQGNEAMLQTIILASIAAIIVQSSSSFALTRLLSVQAQKLIAVLRVQVQKKILSLPIHYFDNSKSGALVSRIMTDVRWCRLLFDYAELAAYIVHAHPYPYFWCNHHESLWLPTTYLPKKR